MCALFYYCRRNVEKEEEEEGTEGAKKQPKPSPASVYKLVGATVGVYPRPFITEAAHLPIQPC